MTSDEEIQHLMTVPPKPALTFRDKVERTLGWVTALIAVAGLTVAIIVGLSGAATAVEAKKAGDAAHHATECINDTLANRAAVTAADNKANRDVEQAITNDAKSFGVLLTDILTSAPSSKSTPDFIAYIKVHDTLVKVSAAAAKTLAADQAFRDSHPLGLC